MKTNSVTKTSAPRGAWEVKLEIMTDQQRTDRPKDGHEGSQGGFACTKSGRHGDVGRATEEVGYRDAPAAKSQS